MKVSKTKLDGVLRIELDVFEDFRGQFVETYNDKIYLDNGIEVKFVQDDPQLNISWPTDTPILSERDHVGHFV